MKTRISLNGTKPKEIIKTLPISATQCFTLYKGIGTREIFVISNTSFVSSNRVCLHQRYKVLLNSSVQDAAWSGVPATWSGVKQLVPMDLFNAFPLKERLFLQIIECIEVQAISLQHFSLRHKYHCHPNKAHFPSFLLQLHAFIITELVKFKIIKLVTLFKLTFCQCWVVPYRLFPFLFQHFFFLFVLKFQV